MSYQMKGDKLVEPAPDALLREALDAHEQRRGQGPYGHELIRCKCGWDTLAFAPKESWSDHRYEAVRAALAATPPASAELRDAIQFDAIPTLLIFAEGNEGVRDCIARLRKALVTEED